MSTDNKSTRDTGIYGEDLVCDRLRERGLKIIDRNVRKKRGEIDIVALDGDILVFVEVRTRRDTTLGHPAETITPSKQRVIRRTAQAYLVQHKITNRPIRFDVVTIIWNTMEFEYFENAF